QREPSPADLVMVSAAASIVVIVLIRRNWKLLNWIDIPLVLYLGYVAIQAIITLETIDIRFALITLYLGISYFVIKYVLILNGQRGFRWLWLAYIGGAV